MHRSVALLVTLLTSALVVAGCGAADAGSGAEAGAPASGSDGSFR